MARNSQKNLTEFGFGVKLLSMLIDEKFNARIEARREELQMSMLDLAIRSDVAYDTLRRYERRIASPGYRIRRKLCKALDLHPVTLEVGYCD